jgi:hypothetical protein
MGRKVYLSVFCVLLLLGAFCVFSAAFGGEKAPSSPDDAGIAETSPEAELTLLTLSSEALESEALSSETLGGEGMGVAEEQDLILSSYRDEAFSEDVLAFFHGLTGSREIAEAILVNSSVYNVAPALAFSLCAEESRFNPRALNRNKNETIDRGLFQLNNASFPKLKIEDFFDSNTNASNGISHLRWCLNSAGTEVSALAMYNAGAGRVHSVGTPKSTLDYVSRILKRQRDIEERFADYYCRLVEERNAHVELAEKEEKIVLRLSLLAPLGR